MGGVNGTRLVARGAVIAALAAGSLVVASGDASAQWRRGGWGGGWGGPGIAAGVLGGVAAGAIIAGANQGPYYGGPAPVYDSPGPRCWLERRNVWDGYGYVRRRVRVCQ